MTDRRIVQLRDLLGDLPDCQPSLPGTLTGGGTTVLFNQMFRAARLDKKLYTQLFFDSYATGNSVVAVALVYAVIYLGIVAGSVIRFDLIRLLWFMLGGLVGWLVVAGGLWLAATKIFQSSGVGATAVRLTGFSHTPLLVLIAASFVPPGVGRQLIIVAALVWFGASLAVAAQAMFDLDVRQALLSALMAIAVWWVLQLIGIGGDLAQIFRFF